jgi:uncharacterized protein YuzE
MKITFDEKADALYIQFQKGSIAKTRKVNDGVLIDIDKKGRLFGIEILDVSQRMPKKSITDLNIHLPVKSAI